MAEVFLGRFVLAASADHGVHQSQMPVLRLVNVVRGTAGYARGRIASPVGYHRLRRRLLSNVAAVLESRAILEIRCTLWSLSLKQPAVQHQYKRRLSQCC